MDTTAKRLKWISGKIRLAASAAIDSCNRIAYFPNGVKDLDQDDLTLTESEVRDGLGPNRLRSLLFLLGRSKNVVMYATQAAARKSHQNPPWYSSDLVHLF